MGFGFIWNGNMIVLILSYPIANHTKSRSCMARGMGRRVRVGHRHERGIPDGQPRLVLCVSFVIHGIFMINIDHWSTTSLPIPLLTDCHSLTHSTKVKMTFVCNSSLTWWTKIPAPPKKLNSSTLFIANQGFWDKGKQIAPFSKHMEDVSGMG